jgi:hypothetical protein
MTQATKTAGQQLATELRAYFGIGTRTRRRRDDRNLITEMLRDLLDNGFYPGIHGPERTEILRPGFAVALAWGKHVDGYRIDGVLRAELDKLSPWQFANLLGRMVDAGVTNNGEGERFFDAMTRTMFAPKPAKRKRPVCDICGWEIPATDVCRRTELHWTSTAILPDRTVEVAPDAEALLVS